MTLFRFVGVHEGAKETFTAEREAGSKSELVAVLRKEGIVALNVEPARSKLSARSFNLNISLFSGVGASDKILFARNLASMIAAGLPLSRAIGILSRQTKSKTLREAIEAIERDLRQGMPLNGALAQYPKIFPPLLIAMARAGEASGTLADALQTAALQMEKNYILRKKIRGAMIYPAIVFIVMIGVGVLMLVYVVPELAATFSSLGTALPLPTRIVLGVSTFALNNLLFMGVRFGILVVAIMAALRTSRGKAVSDWILLKMPVVGRIVMKSNSARTARTLGSLLKAGVSSLPALDITQEAVPNTHFRAVVAAARRAVERGSPLSQSFLEASAIYPAMFSEMVAVGEETGDIPGMLSRVADFYEGEVEEETKDISTVIEPILMVVIGGGVGFFAIAMIAPIYSLSSSL